MAQGFTSLPDLMREEHLSCKICFELYKTPKILPCLHSYCQRCLEALIKNNSLQCPECRLQVDVKDGIDSLKTNFYINNLLELFEPKKAEDLRCAICSSDQPVIARCLDCNDFLCRLCNQGHRCSRQTLNHKVVSLKEFLEGQHDAEVKPCQEMYCQDHQKEPLRLFCKTCNSAICRDCHVLIHFKHEVESMADEAQKKRSEVKKLIKGLDSNIMKISEQQKAVKESIEMLIAAGDSIRETVTDYADKVTTHIVKQKEATLDQLSTFQIEQMEKYVSMTQELQNQMDKAVNAKNVSQKVMEVGKDYEIIDLEKTMRDQIKELQNFNPQQLENKIPELDIALDTKEILSKALLFSLVFSLKNPTGGMQTPATGLSNEERYRAEQSKTASYLNLASNIPVVNTQNPRPVRNLFCAHTFDIDEDEDDEEDNYEPKVTGIAAFPGEGGILVADSENNDIKRFSFNGDLRRTIVLSDDDDVTVCSVVICGNTLACSADCYLYFLTLGGSFQRKLKLRGAQDDFKYPITSFESEYVAVSEGTLCSVSLYNTNGECIDRVRPHGFEGGRFLFIAINSLENFIVSDFTKQQIVIFKRYGEIIHIIDSFNSMLTKPFSLCVDKSDCIFVVDTDKVIQFSADGENGEVVLSANNGVKKPRLVTTDSYGRLVLLHQDTQIKIYEF